MSSSSSSFTHTGVYHTGFSPWPQVALHPPHPTPRVQPFLPWALGPLSGHALVCHSGIMLPSRECCQETHLCRPLNPVNSIIPAFTPQSRRWWSGHGAPSQESKNTHSISSPLPVVNGKKGKKIGNKCVLLPSVHIPQCDFVPFLPREGCVPEPGLGQGNTSKHYTKRGWKAFAPLAALSPSWKIALGGGM